MGKKTTKKKVVKRKAVKKKTAKKVTKKKRPGLSDRINLPVIVGPDTLPLLDPNFEWEKFEKFSKALISKIFEDTTVNIMGKKGEKQYGIDLIAENKNGTSFFAQCKRYKAYSVKQFIKTKNELELTTDKCILLLACEAGAELRLEALGDDKWEIWDVHDISNKVFSLGDSDRLNIIKRFFGPEWAKAFSGYNQFSSLVSPLEYFKVYLNSKKLFNHLIPFIGREQEQKSLKDFIKSKHSALVLNASGGIGKSRLLWETAKGSKISGWDILFIKEEVAPLAEHFENIKSDKILFVFDDAHRYDLSPYLALIQLLNCEYKVIFSTRPQAKNTLKLSLTKLNIESQEIQDFELLHFNEENAKGIVDKLLPNLSESHIWPLAKIMAESTLIGTLACNLIKRKSITLSSLANDSDIKNTVMARFKEELSGNIESNIEERTVKNVLDLISAVAPIPYKDGNIDKSFLATSDIDENEMNECIADLLYSGILVERGYQLRITPDILSDCILEDACYLKTGQPSAFFKDLFNRTSENLRNNLLKNISELDWRMKKNSLTNSILLKEFWNGLKVSEDESLYSISTKLEIVEGIAYYQPIESYEYLNKVFEYISNFEEEDEDYQYRSCKETIVRIARDIIVAGYKTNSLMMILWKLGKSDIRDLNPHPNHPIRQISDLCSYERNLPVKLYENTFTALRNIINIYNSEEDLQNPVALLKGFLAKSSHSTYSRGNSISWSPFLISYENTKDLREQVISLLHEISLSTDNIKKAHSAVKILSKTLTPPHSVMGLKVTKDDMKVWTREVKKGTEALIHIYKKTPFPLIKLEIRKVFSWERRWNHFPSSKKIVNSFLKSNLITSNEIKYIPFSFWTYRDVLIKRDPRDIKKMQQREKSVQNKTISDSFKLLDKTSDFLEFGDQIIKDLRIVGERPTSHLFSIKASEIDSFNNVEMCQLLLKNNSNTLEHDFNIFLEKVSNSDLDKALRIADEALNLKSPSILCSISQSFWWIFEKYVEDSKVKELFVKFYNNQHESVKVSSTWALRNLIKLDKKYAIDSILDFSVSSTNQAQALVELIEPRYNIPPSDLDDKQLTQTLEKIKDVNDLTHHNIQEFIDVCADRIPVILFEILIYRVGSKNNQSSGFTALPYLGFNKSLKLNVDDKKCIEIFEEITTILKSEDADTFWLPNLFYDLAKSKYDLSLDYLNNLIRSEDLETVQAGLTLLRKFNSNIVFSKQEWIRELLKHGKDKGKEYYDKIKDYLYILGIPTSKQGTAGEPMPQDVALVENSKKAMDNSKFDFEKNFYLKLKEHGEREIEEDRVRNERRLD